MLSIINFSPKSKKIALLSHRNDRMRRTVSMVKFIVEYGFDIVVISIDNDIIEKELRFSGYKGEIISITTGFIEELEKRSSESETYWIGLANIKTTFAESVMSYFGVT